MQTFELETEAPSMTLNVNLTPRLENIVRQKVADGLYNNASEVIRDALRLMEAKDQLHEAQLEAIKLDALRDDLREGIASGSAGALDMEAIKQRGREKLKTR
jgi:antitoxin ParD1/3/4